MIIETERLILRPWTDDDAPALYPLAADPDVGPRAGWPPHRDEADSLNIIRRILAVPETYAVILKATGELMGSASIMELDPPEPGVGEIGYWIGKPYWGRGYIPEAVHALIARARDGLGVTRLICGYFEGNDQSRRVQEKCGFVPYLTVRDKPVPALGTVVTEVYSYLSFEKER